MKKISTIALIALTHLAANAQGTFQNLDFDQANPVSIAGSPY